MHKAKICNVLYVCSPKSQHDINDTSIIHLKIEQRNVSCE